jgi:hypothetical protein
LAIQKNQEFIDMLINGTVLGVAPIRTSLFIVCGILAALFTLMKPEMSAGLSFGWRFVFWVSHIAAGLGGILLASYLLRFCTRLARVLFLSVTLTGVAGAFLSAPIYVVLESLFSVPAPANGSCWFSQWVATGWWQQVLVEALNALPILLLSWYAVNLPLFFNQPQLLNDDVPPDDPNEPDHKETKEAEQRQRTINDLFERLPEVIGRDIVAISSDLHYLNVHTRLGKVLILGSLKTYADAFAEQGLLVHRSHWVAKSHVERVHVAANTAVCIMSTGLRVPISRSKRKEVKDIFGGVTQTPREIPLNLVKNRQQL